MKELRILMTVNDGAQIDFSGSTVAVIDVLRATTSMAFIFASGAVAVYPVGEVEAARKRKENMPLALLCGERNGLPPDGFDMGNSPAAFGSTDLSGKEVILTTTNGTAAVARAEDASVLLTAACGNAEAAADYMCENSGEGPLYLLCAGTQGSFSIEDFYCAGLIASCIETRAEVVLGDLAWAAVTLARLPADEVVNSQTCRHLDFLLKGGFEDDVTLAFSQWSDGAGGIVPIYDKKAGCFRPVGTQRD